MVTTDKDLYRPQTPNEESARKIIILTANNTEDLEFFYPYYRFTEAGYKVDVVTPDGGELKGKQGLGLKQTKKISQVIPEDYELLYIPGGKAPAVLKENREALAFTRNFAASKKPIAAVCHGPQLLAKAGVIKNTKIAAWPDVKVEVEEAGATYVDQQTIVDGQYITARWPGDLPSHLKTVLEYLNHSKKTDAGSIAA